MAETVSDGDIHVMKPPSKRRRILDPSAVVPVPVYSNKVSSSLQLNPTASLFCEKENPDDDVDDSLWAEFSSRVPLVMLSDSEDEAEPPHQNLVEDLSPPPPPPPESPVQKQSRKATEKINEINRKIRAVSSILSPEPQDRRSRRRRTPPPSQPDWDQEDRDDDVILMSPDSHNSPNGPDSVREIPLKIRCRTDVYKIPVLSSTALTDVVRQLSVILNVPPDRLLLLQQEVELPTHSSVGELGLGIADIIECVVMAAEDESGSGSSITVKLQSKDRDSFQEFSIHREAPLDSIFSRYLSGLPASARTTVRFHFDGSKVTGLQTPAQLDMEDGDIIEVWL